MTEDKEKEIRFSDFVFNPNLFSVRTKGVENHLTFFEFNILEMFIKHQNLILTVDEIRNARRSDYYCSDSAVRAIILALRRKIGPRHIISRWGFGYMFID